MLGPGEIFATEVVFRLGKNGDGTLNIDAVYKHHGLPPAQGAEIINYHTQGVFGDMLKEAQDPTTPAARIAGLTG